MNKAFFEEMTLMIRIGLLSTLIGPYQIPGEDAVRGAKLALSEVDNAVAGQEITLDIYATNALSTSAYEGIRTLLDEHKVDLVVGPLSGDEAEAVRDFARTRQERVFLNGSAGSQEIYNPSPNFFSFSPNGVQMAAGLGRYVFHEMGYRRVVTIGEGYSFPFAQIGAFSLEFCEAGGEITEMIWCGLGTQDFTPFLDRIPPDVDAIFSTMGGADGVSFIRQCQERGVNLPILGGTIMGDASLLHSMRDYAEILEGVVCCSPVCDDLPDANWRRFVAQYQQAFGEDGFYSPSLFAFGYYTNMRALLLALQTADGDLSDGQAQLKSILPDLTFEGVTCELRLDRHRFPIIDNFINQIAVSSDGVAYTKLLKRVEAVDSVLGYSDEDWLGYGHFAMTNMPCGKWSAYYNPLFKTIQKPKRA
jgi:branched-chain amino acid transport system substrate-binding protein